MQREDRWQFLAARLFCFCVFFVVGYLCLRYLMPVILPFLTVFFIAWVVSSVAKRLSKFTGIPQGVWAFLTVTAMVVFIGLSLFYVCRHILGEIKQIVMSVSSDGIVSFYPGLDKIPLLKDILSVSDKYAEDVFGEWLVGALKGLSGAVGQLLSRAARATPSALIASVVTLISLYYMSVDFDGVCAFFNSLLPKKCQSVLTNIKKGAAYVFVRLIRAYAIIFIVTFVEIFAGLMILCPSFACLGALIIAVVDILPIFGAGLILIPWGIISLIGGETFLGVGLLILYVIVTVVRQIIEPKFVGESMGIHPIGSVISMFVGYRLLGFLGMLAAPMALCTVLRIKRNGGLYCKATVDSNNLSCDK